MPLHVCVSAFFGISGSLLPAQRRAVSSLQIKAILFGLQILSGSLQAFAILSLSSSSIPLWPNGLKSYVCRFLPNCAIVLKIASRVSPLTCVYCALNGNDTMKVVSIYSRSISNLFWRWARSAGICQWPDCRCIPWSNSCGPRLSPRLGGQRSTSGCKLEAGNSAAARTPSLSPRYLLPTTSRPQE